MLSSEKSEQEEQDMIDESIAILDSMEHPFQAQKKLIMSVLVDTVLLVIVLAAPKIFPYYVADWFVEDAFLLFVLVLFVIGFLIGYALFMLFQVQYLAKTHINIQTGLMSGYSHAEKSSKKFQLYFFASFCGILNILIFLVLSKIV